jgi:serine protease Do
LPPSLEKQHYYQQIATAGVKMKKGHSIRWAIALWLACFPNTRGDRALRQTPVVEVVRRVLPSVVNIGTERIVQVRYADPFQQFRRDVFDDFFREFFGGPRESLEVRHSLGSGVIIDPAGYILSNFHVVERASRIRVKLADRSEYEAVFVAGDPLNDLALIKIEPQAPLQAVDLAEDDDVMLGETVIVMGNPFGLEHTVTVGVVSAQDREARYQGQVLFRDILQTDAAVNPGSSGGPMLNLDGQLIGINVAIYREAQNIGFAVPVKRVREWAGRWLAPMVTRRLTPGFEVTAATGKVSVAFTYETAGPTNAEIQAGDIITAVSGQPVRSVFDFHRALLPWQPGQTFSLTVERDGRTKEVSAVLLPPEKPAGALLAKQRLGLEFSANSRDVRGVLLAQGLTIEKVDPESRAAAAGLRKGMIITRINGVAIRTLDDVGYALQFVRTGDPVQLAWQDIEDNGSLLMVQQSAITVNAL